MFGPPNLNRLANADWLVRARTLKAAKAVSGSTTASIQFNKAWQHIRDLAPAISSAGGHDQTLHVACEIARFGIKGAMAFKLLKKYNDTSAFPKWSDKELLHKSEDGYAKVVADNEFGIYFPVEAGVITYRNLSTVEAKAIAWLWLYRIALGKITILAGDPGIGKSFLTLFIAVCVSRGLRWPDGGSAPRGNVLLLSAEDDAADTIRPRVEKMGGDLSKIVVIDGIKAAQDGADKSFSLDRDLPALTTHLKGHPECKLLVVDPITAYLGNDVDSHRNSDVRALLAPLSKLAADFNIAVICVTHLSKGVGGKAIYRATGSLAFVAAARAAWLVAADPDDDTRRLFLMIKNNIAKAQSGLAYRIDNGKLVWSKEPVDLDANQVLEQDTGAEPTSELNEAIEWLAEALAAGPVEATEILRQGRANGHQTGTLKRSKKKLGIKSRRVGGVAADGKWEWYLPVYPPKEA